MKTFKLIWKMVFTVLDIILSIDSDGRKASRYSPLRAHILHENGLISSAEYRRSLGND